MANNRYSQVKAKRVSKGLAAGATGGGGSITVSDTAPSSPSAGDLWFDSTVLRTYVYYNDGTSSQWVLSNPIGLKGPAGDAGAAGSSVTAYANTAAFPSSGNTVGDFAFASDTKSLYNWDGSEWDRISSGPQIGPRYTTTPTSEVSLSTSGVASTLTAVAVDESGFPITYDWDAYSGSTVYNASSLPPQLTAVSESNGVFTLTPSTSDSDEGEVTFRTKASDGVLFTPAITNLSLIFNPMASYDQFYSFNNNLTNTGTNTSQQLAMYQNDANTTITPTFHTGANSRVSNQPVLDMSLNTHTDVTMLMGNNSNLDWTTSGTTYSFGCWYKPDFTISGNKYLFSYRTNGGNGFFIMQGGSIEYTKAAVSGTSVLYSSFQSGFNVANWNNYILVCDGVNQTVKLYINGVLENTTTSTTPALLGTGPVIGTYGQGYANSYRCSGYFDNLFVEYSAISQSDVTKIALYNG